MEEDGKRNDLARMPGIARVLGVGRAGPPGAPFPENVSDAALGPRRGGCAPGRGATGGVGKPHKPRTTGVCQRARTSGCFAS